MEGLSDFENLWCDFPKAWKLLCLRANGSSWNVVSGRGLRGLLSQAGRTKSSGGGRQC